LLDPGGEQLCYLLDARRAQVRPPGGGIDPAEVGLAVELRQRVEERPGRRVGLQRFTWAPNRCARMTSSSHGGLVR